MTTTVSLTRPFFLPKSLFTITAMTISLLICMVAVQSANAETDRSLRILRGFVEGNGSVQPQYKVSLYAGDVSGRSDGRVLGTATTNDDGKFEIRYRLENWYSYDSQPVLFVIAEEGPVMLASAIGTGLNVPQNVVVNERTTVATGTAFAQFIEGRKIRGNTYGMINAVKMAENLANPKTGDVGEILIRSPNGTETSTYPTFNSLTNVVASCVANDADCDTLFKATTPAGGPEPTTVLQAVANIAKYPWYPGYPVDAEDPLFVLSQLEPVNQPALGSRPTNWLLFLKFTGAFDSTQDETNLMNGPGNLAIDEHGFAWINDNYVPQPVLDYACAGLRLMKFYPWGESFPGSPYFGGGLSGAGFGITLDPRGNIWVGNFGFEAPDCADKDVYPFPDPKHKIPATHNSMSLFRPDGVPLSSFSGFTKGDISWPQATVSDKEGNIWVANCGNDSVTFIPEGNPWRARNFPLPGATSTDEPEIKPFAIAIDPWGRAWVTGNKSGEVYRIRPDGYIETLDSKGLLAWPMGISGDSEGNMYVSSADAVNVPCIDPLMPQGGENPSIVFYPAHGGEPMQFQGGGLSIPWGSAIDGNDSLWVFNFGHTPLQIGQENEYPVTGISHFCGIGECPEGLSVGDPISPSKTPSTNGGYTSDALDRITGGGIDPSGNIWLLNNWKKDAPAVYDTNPGGNSFVIVPGAAVPVKTPLIGPPESFDNPRPWKDHSSSKYKRDKR